MVAEWEGHYDELYHGTTNDFDEINLTKSKPSKDFGRGFYLSAEVEQAKDFAQTRAFLLSKHLKRL
ncbi:DUF3990 domain-containing protein [Hoylesella shahii]|uniref:DUF3990 domain-containing protein n=1 Tax=Hoylesella shahii TaxID=228603 RepID=UPI0028ED6C52|nr:DUF3990 domain-containing protein [Hoylesella shahii]